MRHLIIGIFVLSLCHFAGLCEAQEEGCVTSQCHVTLLKPKVVHAATEACDSCHEPISESHPQQGKKTFQLTAKPPELCSSCHDPLGTKAFVHEPVKEGDCTGCHEPHASEQVKLLVQPIQEVCLTCHSDKTEFANVHGPTATGDCVLCHSPHESDIKSLLIKQENELCATCHSEMEKITEKKTVHPPLLDSCSSCHNPHGSEQKQLLAVQGKELCLQCHSDTSEQLNKAKIIHQPINSDSGCASCHLPHASDFSKLLIKTGKDLCIECHKDIIQKDMTVLHGPINDQTCTPCHNVHASDHQKLLSMTFPAGSYVPYKETEYELCFSCHNRDLLAFPDTSFATNFRDGERNLHYLHVNKSDKGRNCTLCHGLHGSAGSKLIAHDVPFGKWKLPIKFVQTETGGSCAPGCHKLETYNRTSSAEAGR